MFASAEIAPKVREEESDGELPRLEFTRRVLERAEDASLSVLERLEHLANFSRVLDRFFEVAVAGLRTRMGAVGDASDGPGSNEQLQLTVESATGRAAWRPAPCLPTVSMRASATARPAGGSSRRVGE